MNAAVPAMAMARTGVAGALRAAEGRRQVNMDQLLATQQGDAALAGAAANDAAVSNRIQKDRVAALDSKYGAQSSTVVPGADVKAALQESYTPQELNSLLGKKAKSIGNSAVEVATPQSAGSIAESQRIQQRLDLENQARDERELAQSYRERDQFDAEKAQRDAEIRAAADEQAARDLADEQAQRELDDEQAAKDLEREMSDATIYPEVKPPSKDKTETVVPFDESHAALVKTIESVTINKQFSPVQKQELLTAAANWKRQSKRDAAAGKEVSPEWPASIRKKLDLPSERNVQGENADMQRRLQSRPTGVAKSGVAINPAIPLVAGVKAVGRAAKVAKRGVGRIVDNASEALSGDSTHTGRAVRTVMEMIGDDATDRLKRSSSAPVRDAGDRINQAIEESHIAQQRMHKAMETARTGAATMDARKAKALHEADQPSKPMDPKQEYANSPWKMMLEGKLEVPENLQQFVDAKDIANQSTRDEALAAGVPIGKGTGKNVFIRHFTGDTHGILASGSDSVLGSKFVRVMSELNGVAPEQIKKDFFGLDALGKGAGVRLDPMEIGRKYKEFPSHLRDGDNYIRLLETDPSRYVRSTFEGTARRIGFYKAFGGAVDVSDLSKLMPQLDGVADAQKAAVVRAINAYNGFGELRWNAGDRGAVEGINNAKRVVGSLLTSATAPVDVSEVLNVVNHVPLSYALEGIANSAVRNKRAVAEGGLDSDVKNRVDLRGAATQATGNFAAGVQRAAGRNVVNRYTHTVGYEGGRAWAKHMQEEGVTLLDEGFLTANRVSPEMQARFREKRASDTDVKVLATMIAENMTGAKKNLAQTARGSRLEIVNTMGALFRRYGENRVRNMLRTIDGAKAIMANEKAPMRVRLATASAMLAQSAAGLGVSASAATAIGSALTYGISALGMFWESKESNVPLLANVVGGAVPGSMLNYMSRDSANPGVAVASMLSWPVMVGNLIYTAASKGEPSRLVPAVRRVKEALSSDDRGGKLAQQIMYSTASKLYGSRTGAAEQSDDGKARSDFRKRLLAGDEDGAQAVLSSYLPTLSEADKKKFLGGLPYVGTFGTKRMDAILEAMPLKARRYIMRHDSDAKRIVEQFTREE
jgi:hypothetical protein